MLPFLLALNSPAYASEEGALAAIPFGVAHFMWGKPVRGIVYAGTQAAGVTAAALGSVKAAEANELGDDDALSTWQIVAGGGVALATTSFLVQCIDGSRLAEIRAAEQARIGIDLFDAGSRTVAVTESVATNPLGLGVAPLWSPLVWSSLPGPTSGSLP